MRGIVIDPAGVPVADALEANRGHLDETGLEFELRQYPDCVGDRLAGPGVAARAALLNDALAQYDVVLCARGGYGISDLLERLDWPLLESCAPRLVVGFSDITALQCALYARLGWVSLHAPMPGSTLWRPHGDDVAAVIDVLRAWPGECGGAVAVRGDLAGSIEGPLFGGCLSVLGALIGTPYFPRDLAGHVVFLEEVNENAARVLRYWNQWRHSGALDGVAAVVLGRFVHADASERAALEALPGRIAERSDCPVFTSTDFGHVCPNFPLMTGASASIEDGRLTWAYSPGPMLAGV